jgi:hypothetical protein
MLKAMKRRPALIALLVPSALLAALCVGIVLALAPSALATFPGENGKVAFVHTERR